MVVTVVAHELVLRYDHAAEARPTRRGRVKSAGEVLEILEAYDFVGTNGGRQGWLAVARHGNDQCRATPGPSVTVGAIGEPAGGHYRFIDPEPARTDWSDVLGRDQHRRHHRVPADPEKVCQSLRLGARLPSSPPPGASQRAPTPRLVRSLRCAPRKCRSPRCMPAAAGVRTVRADDPAAG